ncbi:Na+/H+ antiporter subunit E [Hellea sp.]|nr:Na+/H+ antiporter subunit E [Hellea sp.]
MRFAFILAIMMTVTWLTLSGYFIPLILTFGVISIAIVVWMCARMRILDGETVPYLSSLQTVSYFVWLFVEIVKANVQVVKAVLSPDMEVSPTLVKIPINSEVDIAETMFANSITLTPGTVAVDMQPDHILVHALLEEMSAPEDFKEMGERSAWAVGFKAEES